MGLFDSPRSGVQCPYCGARRASKTLWKVKCANPNCVKFDSEYAAQVNQNRIVGRNATDVFSGLHGNFSPRSPVTVRFENYLGDQLLYLADAHGAYRAGECLVMRVAPTGKHVAFRLSAIVNRSEVEGSLTEGDLPSANERRILNFHLRRGTSSPLFVQIRQKFPDYEP